MVDRMGVPCCANAARSPSRAPGRTIYDEEAAVMFDRNTVCAIAIGNGRSHITALYLHRHRYVVQERRTIFQPYRAVDRGTICVV